MWLNLYLPSVKLVKKVRVGSKVRRVYDAAQTAWERVLACAQANPAQVAGLKTAAVSGSVSAGERRSSRNWRGSTKMANRRLSPKTRPDQQVSKAEQKRQRTRSRRNGRGKAAATAGLRLHFQCLDGPPQGYILKCLDASRSVWGGPRTSDFRPRASDLGHRASDLGPLNFPRFREELVFCFLSAPRTPVRVRNRSPKGKG